MESIWLCCDSDAAEPIDDGLSDSSAEVSHNSPVYMGIFTDAPATLGQILPRPVTPVPPECPPASSKSSDFDDNSHTVNCMSPPTQVPGEMDSLRFCRISCPLVFF